MEKQNTVIIDDTDNEKSQAMQATIKARCAKANEKTFTIIEDFIAGGYEKNLALLLVYLPEERCKQALQKLPENVRKKVSDILETCGDKKNCDADVMSAAGTVLKNADFYGEQAASELVEGEDATFVHKMHDSVDVLFAVNPLLAMNLEYYLVNLDILIDLSDRDIQKWLREVETTELAKALKGSSKMVQEKVFRNMSHRGAGMLKEDMDFMGPVKKSDVLASQKNLVKIVRRLESSGDIIIPATAFGSIGEETI
ncbi:MAG: hypothetical protein K6E51_00660 [Treponema sp.]|nr:hypothetical protein [Treponema sp.]